MSHFYGTLQGGRGRATRCGTVKSKMVAEAASWQGAIRVELMMDRSTERDWARVELIPWRGVGVSRLLYLGPVDAPKGGLADDR